MCKIFTRGLAFGEGFCNRQAESKQLKLNIKHGTHTLIISPRRYGKTSLALNVINSEKILYAHIDLFMKYNNSQMENEFYDRIGDLISHLIKPTEKAIKNLQSILKNVKISLSFGKTGFELSLSPTVEKKQSLKFLLEDLDQLLLKNKKKAIIFIDELQTMTESDYGDDLEAMLRFIAQKAQNIVFIFSGSNRHLLEEIFADKLRPFYKLCYHMAIQKISDTHYYQHLNKFSEKQWGKPAAHDALEQIIQLTYCHPYYINVLCEKLFQQKDPPSKSDVIQSWLQVCLEEQSTIGRTLELLTPKQKQLLSVIAKHPDLKEPTSKAFLSKTNLTAKGVLDAMKILYQHDLIEKMQNGCITIIDPVLAFWAHGLVHR